MTARQMIQRALSEHDTWWPQVAPLIEAGDQKALRPVACASASAIGLAVAMAWIEREAPEKADELASTIRHYVDNGGDDADLFGPYRSEQPS